MRQRSWLVAVLVFGLAIALPAPAGPNLAGSNGLSTSATARPHFQIYILASPKQGPVPDVLAVFPLNTPKKVIEAFIAKAMKTGLYYSVYAATLAAPPP